MKISSKPHTTTCWLISSETACLLAFEPVQDGCSKQAQPRILFPLSLSLSRTEESKTTILTLATGQTYTHKHTECLQTKQNHTNRVAGRVSVCVAITHIALIPR